MTQEHHKTIELLESGIELISPHLRWLIRNLIVDAFGSDTVDHIAFRPDIPIEEFGVASPASKSITINLLWHFDSVINKIIEGTLKNTSVKAAILHELLDTAGHEGHHLFTAHMQDIWDEACLDEEGAVKAGNKLSWGIARSYEVEVQAFGPYLDDMIIELIDVLRIEITEDEKEGKKVENWKLDQVHMYDNSLAYFNRDHDKSLGYRKAFEVGADNEDPWVDEPRKFILETPIETDTDTTITEPPVGVSQPNPIAVNTPVSGGMPAIVPANTTPLAPTPTDTTQGFVNTGQQGGVIKEVQDYEIYDDQPYENTAPPATGTQTTVPPIVQQPPAQIPVTTNTAVTIGAGNKLITVENVLRRLFHHINIKGEFNSLGGYNNPEITLEPVSIADIPGAQELFVAMDTVDALGKFTKQGSCNGSIKGLVSKNRLPRYTLYLNLDGQLHKRTFIAQNPDKMAADGTGYTTWAQKVRAGGRVMMLLEDGQPPRADIQLEAGQTLGQEIFNVWQR